MTLFCHDPRRLVGKHQLATSVYTGTAVWRPHAETRFPGWIASRGGPARGDKVSPFRPGLQFVQGKLDKEGKMGSPPKRRSSRLQVCWQFTEEETDALEWIFRKKWTALNRAKAPGPEVAARWVMLTALAHWDQIEPYLDASILYAQAEAVDHWDLIHRRIAAGPWRRRSKTKK